MNQLTVYVGQKLIDFWMNTIVAYHDNGDGTFSSQSCIGRWILREGARDGYWEQVNPNTFKLTKSKKPGKSWP